jgi:hypothetical protein
VLYIKIKYLQKQKKTAFKMNKLSILKNHPKIKTFLSVIFDVDCVMQGAKGLWIAGFQIKKTSHG